MLENWRRLLFPRTIAIVGASERGFASGHVHENLRSFGFAGDIIPINPRHQTVFGLRSYPSLLEAPRADAAIMLLSRDGVEEAVGHAIATHVGGIIVIAGGFRESGEPAWAAVETRMSDAARQAGIPLIGPNCLGVMALPLGAMMSIAPFPWKLRTGSVALLMQSGGQLIASCRYVDYLGAGLRWAFSLGNGTTVSFAEAIAALADDPDVREFVLLIEEIPDWPAFRSAVDQAHRAGKWISASTIGRTPLGRWASKTHTGAASTNNDILVNGLAQLGIRMGETLGTSLAAAVLHSRLGPPRAGRIAISGVSGGGAGLAADYAASHGIELATLDDATKAEIQRINPEIRAGNPLDIVGGPMDLARFRDVFRTYLEAPDVGVGLYLPSQGLPDESTPAHLEVLENVAIVAETGGTPVIVSSVVYAPMPELQRRRFLSRANLCLMPVLEEGFAALKTWRADPLDLVSSAKRPAEPFRSTGSHDPDDGADVVQPFNEFEIKRLLAEIGCHIPDSRFLSFAEASKLVDAVPGAFAGLPWPSVAKGVGRRIFHKARLGLVKLDLADPRGLQAALRDILGSPHKDLVEGILIERQADSGTDVMASVLRDRLGIVVVIGGGGENAGEAGSSNWIGIDPTVEELLTGAARILAPIGAERFAQALATFASGLVRVLSGSDLSLIEVNPARIQASGVVTALDAVAT